MTVGQARARAREMTSAECAEEAIVLLLTRDDSRYPDQQIAAAHVFALLAAVPTSQSN